MMADLVALLALCVAGLALLVGFGAIIICRMPSQISARQRKTRGYDDWGDTDD